MNGLLLILLVLGVVSLGTNVWFFWRVFRPLRHLSRQTAKLAQGDLSALQKPFRGIREIGILRHNMASMAGHVRRTQEETAARGSALTDGQEAERARIAHELHDDTTQSLVAIAQSIDLATNWMASDPQRTAQMLKLARSQAVDSVENLRRLIANLRPPALEELGLIPALRMLVEGEPEVSMSITATGVERRLREAQELTLFRSVQEAIRNAQRHGHANQINIEVAYQPHEVRLIVEDNGSGFHLTERLDCLAQEGHYGLLGIQERIQHFGGKFHIASKPGTGTRIEVILPLESLHQPTEVVRDPVCGAVLQPEQAYGSVLYEGTLYYFCCPVCQGAFQQNPQTYLSPTLPTAKALPN